MDLGEDRKRDAVENYRCLGVNVGKNGGDWKEIEDRKQRSVRSLNGGSKEQKLVI